jgi:CxxC motif-containing protein (DUF1111 family)
MSSAVGRCVRGVGLPTAVLAAVALTLPHLSRADEPATASGDQALGRKLFHREWRPNDERSPAGDGLGPMFNESSCVACHNQGGSGGGGPSSQNVDILTADIEAPPRLGSSLTSLIVWGVTGIATKSLTPERHGKRAERIARELDKIHPGLAATPSVVLHRSSTDLKYAVWLRKTQFAETGLSVDEDEQEAVRSKVQFGPEFKFQAASRGDGFTVSHSQRNPTALFGAGWIDSIPAAAIESAAGSRNEDFPEILGRVGQTADGAIGRFGWKCQTATLREFVFQACSVELGLEVPGHRQGSNPLSPESESAGLDLTEQECLALTAYVSALPRPTKPMADSDAERDYLDAGSKWFAAIGCAVCHRADLGEVDGLYSDLLLHDMGPELADTGAYSMFQSSPSLPPIANAAEADGKSQAVTRAATARREQWRTPPLWGCRSSGPYLHDGRAESLEEAIAMHGGEAQKTSNRFFSLSPNHRQTVLAFLKSLSAPGEFAPPAADESDDAQK